MAGIVIAAPPGYKGANALAVAMAPDVEAAVRAEASAQPELFAPSGQKVIPFERHTSLERHGTGRLALVPQSAPTQSRAPQTRKPSGPVPEQGSLDFLPATQPAPRTLKTAVPAQIYCEQPVATPTHRLVAGAMDAAMIFLGFGVFVEASELTGGSFGSGKTFWIAMAVSFVLLTLFYGLIWAMAGRETAGMRWTDLHLITFDGFPVDGPGRAARMASAWLSFCSGGLGLLWALADEENLTWHDHISKTFPTFQEVPKSFVRERKR